MPKSIKKKECGIMKGGTAPAPAPAPAPVLTTADAARARAITHRTHSNLIRKIYRAEEITSKELYDYISICYNIERVGILPVTLPMTILSFMDNFSPDNLATEGTTQFCQNLFGFRSTGFRELLTRGASNVSQCKKAGYPRSNLPLVCIWCGEPIYDMAECEHALPILNCAGLLGFSSNPDRSRIEHILEYGYAHRLCNQVKLDVPFLTWNNNNWEINWHNMRQVYYNISVARKGYKNASSLAYTYDDNENFYPVPTGPPIQDNSVVAPHNSHYRGNYDMPLNVPTSQKNSLTENGEHRNKHEILIACKKLATLTNNPVDILAGGAKSKKSKKKQRGGVLNTTLPPLDESTMISDKTALEQYLAQDLPGGGRKWVEDNDNGKLYGPHRMRLIARYCNTHLADFATTTSYKNQILAKIITCVTPEDLAAAFAEAEPANPIGDALKEKAEVLANLYKKVLVFSNIKFNLGNLTTMGSNRVKQARAVTNLKVLEDEKQKKKELFAEIWKIINEYNDKHKALFSQVPSVKIDGTEQLKGIRGGGLSIPDNVTYRNVILNIETMEQTMKSFLPIPKSGGSKMLRQSVLLGSKKYIASLKDKISYETFSSIEKRWYNQFVVKNINDLFKSQEEALLSEPDRDFIERRNISRIYETEEYKKSLCIYATSHLFLDEKLPRIIEALGRSVTGARRLSPTQSKIMLSALISTPVAEEQPTRPGNFLESLYTVLFDLDTDNFLTESQSKSMEDIVKEATINYDFIIQLSENVKDFQRRRAAMEWSATVEDGGEVDIISHQPSVFEPVLNTARQKRDRSGANHNDNNGNFTNQPLEGNLPLAKRRAGQVNVMGGSRKKTSKKPQKKIIKKSKKLNRRKKLK